MNWSFFGFVVCTFRKEPMELSDFDPFYLKNYFEFTNFQMREKTTGSLVKDLQNKINFTQKCFTSPIDLANVFFPLNY